MEMENDGNGEKHGARKDQAASSQRLTKRSCIAERRSKCLLFYYLHYY
jgi:hypothetical protein